MAGESVLCLQQEDPPSVADLLSLAAVLPASQLAALLQPRRGERGCDPSHSYTRKNAAALAGLA